MGETSDAFERGTATMREVYAGDTVDLPEGLSPFYDVMQRTLFAEVWSRDVLSIRDRRLLIMAVMAARGATAGWRTQARAALRRSELNPEELRETLIMLAPYAGFSSLSDFGVLCEEVIGEYLREQEVGDRSQSSTMQDIFGTGVIGQPGRETDAEA